MDAELLAAQISTLNEAIVRLDGRIDAMVASQTEDNQDVDAYETRLAALEREHAECQTQLSTLVSLTEQLAAAEVREAEAEADAAEAEADLLEAAVEQMQTIPEETEEEASETEITELEPETENPSSGASEEQSKKSGNWLEKLIILR